jgi:membrane-bound serine protease (ClpP class)
VSGGIAWTILALSVLAIIFDLHVTTHGAIAAAGAIGLVGSVGWLLSMALPAPLAALISIALAAALILVGVRAFRRLRSLLRRPATDSVVGRVAVVFQPLQPQGWVRIDGVYWRAVSPGAEVGAGEEVLVLGRDGLTLTVAPLRQQEAARIKGSGSAN